MGNKMTVQKAAKLMGVSEQFIRIGLQQGAFPWGNAVKMSSQWTYYINAIKFSEHTGIPVENIEERESE
jgi:hypothetical protein